MGKRKVFKCTNTSNKINLKENCVGEITEPKEIINNSLILESAQIIEKNANENQMCSSIQKICLRGNEKKHKFAQLKGNINKLETLEKSRYEAQPNNVVQTSEIIKNNSLDMQSSNLLLKGNVRTVLKNCGKLGTDACNKRKLDTLSLKENDIRRQMTSKPSKGRRIKSRVPVKNADTTNVSSKVLKELNNGDNQIDVLKVNLNKTLPCNVLVRVDHKNASKSDKFVKKNVKTSKENGKNVMGNDYNNKFQPKNVDDKSDILESQCRNTESSKNVVVKNVVRPKYVAKKSNILGHVRKALPRATKLQCVERSHETINAINNIEESNILGHVRKALPRATKLQCVERSHETINAINNIEESNMHLKICTKINQRKAVRVKARTDTKVGHIITSTSCRNNQISKKRIHRTSSDRNELVNMNNSIADRFSAVTKDSSMQVPYTARFKRFQNNRNLDPVNKKRESGYTVPFVRSKPLFFRVHDYPKQSKGSSNKNFPNSTTVINTNSVGTNAVNSNKHASINEKLFFQKGKNICMNEMQTSNAQTKDKTCDQILQKSVSTYVVNNDTHKKKSASLKEHNVYRKACYVANLKEHPRQVNALHEMTTNSAIKVARNVKEPIRKQAVTNITALRNVRQKHKNQNIQSLGMFSSSHGIVDELEHHLHTSEESDQHTEERIHTSNVSLHHNKFMKNLLSIEVENQLKDPVGIAAQANSNGVQNQTSHTKHAVVNQQKDVQECPHPVNITVPRIHETIQSTPQLSPVKKPLAKLPTNTRSSTEPHGKQIGNHCHARKTDQPIPHINPLLRNFKPACRNHAAPCVSVAADECITSSTGSSSTTYNSGQRCQTNKRVTTTTLEDNNIDFSDNILDGNHTTEHSSNVITTPHLMNKLVPISSSEQCTKPIKIVFTAINSTMPSQNVNTSTIENSKKGLITNMRTSFQNNSGYKTNCYFPIKDNSASLNNAQTLLQNNAYLPVSNYVPIQTISTIPYNNPLHTVQNNIVCNNSSFVPLYGASAPVNDGFRTLQHHFMIDTNYLSMYNNGVHSGNVLNLSKDIIVPSNNYNSLQCINSCFNNVTSTFQGNLNPKNCYVPAQGTHVNSDKSTVHSNNVSDNGCYIPIQGCGISLNTSQEQYGSEIGCSRLQKDHRSAFNYFNSTRQNALCTPKNSDMSVQTGREQPVNNVLNTPCKFVPGSSCAPILHYDNRIVLQDNIISVQKSEYTSQTHGGPVVFPPVQRNFVPDSCYNVTQSCSVPPPNNCVSQTSVIPTVTDVNVLPADNFYTTQTSMPQNSGHRKEPSKTFSVEGNLRSIDKNTVGVNAMNIASYNEQTLVLDTNQFGTQSNYAPANSWFSIQNNASHIRNKIPIQGSVDERLPLPGNSVHDVHKHVTRDNTESCIDEFTVENFGLPAGIGSASNECLDSSSVLQNTGLFDKFLEGMAIQSDHTLEDLEGLVVQSDHTPEGLGIRSDHTSLFLTYNSVTSAVWPPTKDCGDNINGISASHPYSVQNHISTGSDNNQSLTVINNSNQTEAQDSVELGNRELTSGETPYCSNPVTQENCFSLPEYTCFENEITNIAHNDVNSNLSFDTSFPLFSCDS